MSRSPSFDDPRFLALVAIADAQDGVVSRMQVYSCGITRWEVRGQLHARRWQRLGSQTICLHNGPVSDVGHHWAALHEAGPRAMLDGASALIASGLRHFTVDQIRVSGPRGARIRRSRRYDIRQTRRWAADDISPSGLPRVRAEVAAVRGALWARTDRQAILLLTMCVQQSLATAEQLGIEALRIRRDRRRTLLGATINDLLDGARSLGEIDFSRELRRRGLPEPARQVLRRDLRNRYYLDLYWSEHRLVVEIDGIHHAWAENVVGDALRQNSLTLRGDVVLRLPLLGYRLQPDAFFAQIEQALQQTKASSVA